MVNEDEYLYKDLSVYYVCNRRWLCVWSDGVHIHVVRWVASGVLLGPGDTGQWRHCAIHARRSCDRAGCRPWSVARQLRHRPTGYTPAHSCALTPADTLVYTHTSRHTRVHSHQQTHSRTLTPADTLVCTHTSRHTRVYSHQQTHSRALTPADILVSTHTSRHTRVHSHPQTYSCALTPADTLVYTHTSRYTRVHSHPQTYMYSRVLTPADTLVCTHTRRHTHVHSHQQTHSCTLYRLLVVRKHV